MNGHTTYNALFKQQIDDFAVEYEFTANNERSNQEIAEIDGVLNELSQQVSSLDLEIDKLTNHADAFDYTIAVASGVLTGLIDSFYVGEIDWNFDWNGAKADANKTINKIIEDKAKIEGYNGEGRLKGAISFLEEKYRIPSDNAWKGHGFSSATTHHLDDLAHHPTLLGLVANVIATFFRVGLFNDKNGKWHFTLVDIDFKEMTKLWAPVILTALLHWLVSIAERKYSEAQQREIPKPIRILLRTLASAPAAIVLLKVADNWIGHLISDMGGSKNTPGEGMGIPGLFLSLLKEISLIPGVNKTALPKLVNDWYKNDKFDMRKETACINVATQTFNNIAKQMLPVLINEILVRGFYFVRRIINEAQLHGTNWQNYDWQKVLPFSNRTIVRMLTISNGTFVAIDTADAAIRTAISGQYADISTFLAKMALRVNFVGLGRFTIAVFSDIKMGIQRGNRVKKRIDLNSKMLNFYNAKVYYKQSNMWIAAQSAVQATQTATETAKNAVAFFATSFKEMQEDYVKIGTYAHAIENKNPGLRGKIISLLED